MAKGRLLIIGGKEDKNGSDPEMEQKNKDFSPHEILKLLTASKDDRIEVITVASSEPESIRESYTKTFNEIGYTDFDFLDICDDQLHNDYQFKRVSAAKTVFFTGGDQRRIYEKLKDSALKYLLKKNIPMRKILPLRVQVPEPCACRKSSLWKPQMVKQCLIMTSSSIQDWALLITAL